MWTKCFPLIGIFSFLHRECINLQKAVYAIKCIAILKGCFLVLKDSDQSQELQTTAKTSLQFYMFSTQDFSVIQTETRFCYMEVGWKSKVLKLLNLRSFLNFCCLNQSEVQYRQKKSQYLSAFQRVHSRWCFPSQLDRYLRKYIEINLGNLQRSSSGGAKRRAWAEPHS